MTEEIVVKAPTRIDLAGGTLDIWPLYLFLNKPLTLNLAISLYASTKISIRKDKKIVIISADQKRKIEFESLDNIRHKHNLSLITRVISFFAPDRGITVETKSNVPAGAGLAGSSALTVSLCYALSKLSEKKYSKDKLQTIAKNIETQVINVPTGDQDYYPALYGGLNSLLFTIEGVKREKINIDIKRLSKRVLLVYSGTSRNSGINNWEIYKGVLEGNKTILRNLDKISQVSRHMKEAIENSELDGVGELITEEWECRKRLCRGVTTPEIDNIISAGKRNGAMSAKVCGAGGGGCILLYTKEDAFERLYSKLKNMGLDLLKCVAVSKGVHIA